MDSNIKESVESDFAIINGAGFWIRVLARIVDVIYSFIVGVFAGLAAFGLILILQVKVSEEITTVGFVLGFLLGEMGSIIYHSICNSYFGASLGKLVCGLRVINQEGSRCSLKSAIIRELAFYIDSLFLGLIGYISMSRTPWKQRYGDVWAKTLVVKVNDLPEQQKIIGSSFIKVFAIASLFLATFIAIGNVLVPVLT